MGRGKQEGRQELCELRQDAQQHQVEKSGEQLRAMMSWLPAEKKKGAEPAA